MLMGSACALRLAATRATGETVLRCLLVAIALATCATSAWACTCKGQPDGAFESAGVVFQGTAISTERVIPTDCDDRLHPDCQPHYVQVFSVKQALKGFPKETVRIHSYDLHMCGPSYPIGETRWVVAMGDEERGYHFPFCTWFPEPQWPARLADMIDQYQEQRRSLNEAVERRPSDPDALMALAAFYAKTYSRLEALALVDRLLKVEPLHRDGILLRATQLAIGPDQSAVLETLAPYLAVHPDDKDALHQRVLALVRLKRLDEVPGEWRDFTELHGRNLDFSRRGLNNASFRGDRMFKPAFAGAELRSADFSDTWMEGDFAGADMTGASLKGAILSGSNFTGTTLDDADLTGATLWRAKLGGASLKGAKLSGVKLEGALYDDRTIWPTGFDPVAAGAVKQQ
jgi:uncharacterized protein YjbI with pentapeptide repeats